MLVGVPRETCPGEHRVALVPASIGALKKRQFEVFVERGAGQAAGFPDQAYRDAGATVLDSRAEVFAKAGIIVQVRGLGANPEQGRGDLDLLRDGQILIAALEPLTAKAEIEALAAKRVRAFALELVPRITRAQSMDILSSQANLAGYKAVLLGAEALHKIFPMMMTAAGTVTPARVLVIGAGVAGLQAIATAKRLGAVVTGYDVRAVVKEQIESLGAKFLEFDLGVDAQDKGGYAKALTDEQLALQRRLMTKAIGEQDVVITTAAVPGRRAPVLVTREMVEAMTPGSVIVDLAAERGGNCELTRGGETVVHQGVKILGPLNLAATMAFHASTLFGKNVQTFLLSMVTKEGAFTVNLEDEVIRETLVTDGGEIVQPRVREALGLAQPAGSAS